MSGIYEKKVECTLQTGLITLRLFQEQPDRSLDIFSLGCFFKNLYKEILKKIIDLPWPNFSKNCSVSLNFFESFPHFPIKPIDFFFCVLIISSYWWINIMASSSSFVALPVSLSSCSCTSSFSFDKLRNFCFTFSCVFFYVTVFNTVQTYKNHDFLNSKHRTLL